MKIRLGFVSNSSSSSFVLTTDKKITTKEELEEILGECNTFYYSKDEVIEHIFKDIQYQNEDYQKMTDLKKMLYSCNINYVEDFYKILINDVNDNNERFSLDNILENDTSNVTIDDFKNHICNILDKFKTELQNKMVYNFTFCDECGGVEASLADGEAFRNTDNILQTQFR